MLDQLYLLHELYPILAATIDLVFGLLIGSFLNVRSEERFSRNAETVQ